MQKDKQMQSKEIPPIQQSAGLRPLCWAALSDSASVPSLYSSRRTDDYEQSLSHFARAASRFRVR